MGTWYDYTGTSSSLNTLSRSLKGILGSSYNATFTFSTQSFDSFSYDDFGNIVVSSNSSNITLRAKLTPKKDIDNNINIGSPMTRLYLEGYLVGNQNYKGNLPLVMECTLKNEATILTGSFHTVVTLDNSVTSDHGYRLATGSMVKGYFQTNGNLPV